MRERSCDNRSRVQFHIPPYPSTSSGRDGSPTSGQERVIHLGLLRLSLWTLSPCSGWNLSRSGLIQVAFPTTLEFVLRSIHSVRWVKAGHNNRISINSLVLHSSSLESQALPNPNFVGWLMAWQTLRFNHWMAWRRGGSYSMTPKDGSWWGKIYIIINKIKTYFYAPEWFIMWWVAFPSAHPPVDRDKKVPQHLISARTLSFER